MVKDVLVDSRINRVLALRTDSIAMLESLDAIGDFYVNNTVETRRTLKHDLEFKNLQLAKKFLSEFDTIRVKIEQVSDLADSLQQACNAIATRVSSADENMTLFMSKASELEQRKQSLNNQGRDISSFLRRFQMTSDEIDTLYRAPLDDPRHAATFFAAWDRLKKAYAECRAMSSKNFSNAGFELLEVLGQHGERASLRLFEWVEKKCEKLSNPSSSAEEIDPILQTSIRYLRASKTYYRRCQDLVVNFRRTQLVSKFIHALTQGGGAEGAGSAAGAKAIDIHSPDPVRYISDMLAWMHQALASESELLRAVFTSSTADELSSTELAEGEEEQEQKDKDTDAALDAREGSAGEMQPFTIEQMLARCLHGLGRPLRARIIQSLEQRGTIETLYAIADLLTFYEQTFSQLIQTENSVLATLQSSLTECKKLFDAAIERQAELYVQSPPPYSLDLSATLCVREVARQLHCVIRVHNQSLSGITAKEQERFYIGAIMGALLGPVLQSVRASGKGLAEEDVAVFTVNNISVLLNELRAAAGSGGNAANASSGSTNASASCHYWIAVLQKETTTWINSLADLEARKILRRSDLDRLTDTLRGIPDGVHTAVQPDCSQDRVSTVLRAFYASLFTSVAPQFDRLRDPLVREAARTAAAQHVAQVYTELHGLVCKPSSGYDASILAHTPNQIRVLLNCPMHM